MSTIFRRVRGPVLLAAVLAATAGPAGRAAGPDAEIAVPGRANANVSLAAAGSFAAMVWSASTDTGTDIYTATSRDGGRTFGPPSRVNQQAGEASASGEQPPRIVLVPRAGRDPSIVVVWSAKGSAGTQPTARDR